MKSSNHSNLYLLTDRDYLRMKRHSSAFPNCYYCTIEIRIGDEIFSKQGCGEKNRKYYHKQCAELVKLL